MGTTFGVGAGFVILVVISVTPIKDAVPLFALIIFSILLPRFIVLRQYVAWKIVNPFVIGGAVGAIIAANVFLTLSATVIALVLGIMILSTAWLPPLNLKVPLKQPYVYVGLVHSFVATLFGFGAVINAVILQSKLEKLRNTATLAACGLLLNVIKPIAYVSIGYDYRPHLLLALAVFIAAVPGAIIGKRLGKKVPDKKYFLIYRIIVTLVVFNLFYRTWLNA